jgi:hypothetical protein
MCSHVWKVEGNMTTCTEGCGSFFPTKNNLFKKVTVTNARIGRTVAEHDFERDEKYFKLYTDILEKLRK